MSETNKPVFQISQQLFQQLAEWQEKLQVEDELARELEDDPPTEVKTPPDSDEQHSQTNNS
ncbi:hypothetical protein IQ270_17720 [Microcoleus sp. LEGE 07076]|uniref:hypothetical protein n=1 Tax=Microcoleus sp. LEGE 07076 TaxID=915322 RepID=UPI00187FBB6C|nr:hypothetical protein [Microcoleus sp. LEGE 07076]MBE9186471.1 hypothetical protein [Microcoleus sp. LEGE 07076]